MKLHTMVAALALSLLVVGHAETLEFFFSEAEAHRVSKESVRAKGTIPWPDAEAESVSVEVYTPGARLQSFENVEIDLKKVIVAAKADQEIGPFFGHVDSYLVRDSKDHWYLVGYEWRHPGSKRHLGRFRIGELTRISKGVDAFFLVDYMQSATAAPLVSIAEKLGERKDVLDRRGSYYRMLQRAVESGTDKANKSE